MAILNIYSNISSEGEKAVSRLFGLDEGISFRDIAEFCDSIPTDDNSIDVRIHCNGGDVMEGWGMYDRLRATGKEITTTVEGNAASMATVIMMAAPKERRRAYANAQILVHNPWLEPAYIGDTATAEDLSKAAAELKVQQDKILDLYVERCGCDRDEMANLMREDKYISAEEAMKFGLIGEIIQPVSALHIESKSVSSSKMSLLNKIVDAIRSVIPAEAVEEDSPVMAMDLNTAGGDLLHIEREEGEPAVGDGASPDGEWLMPDNTTIVVENGVITDIRQPEEEEPEQEADVVAEDEQKGDAQAEETEGEETELEKENAALKERIAELEQQVAELTEELGNANAMAKTQDDLQVLNMVKMAGGAEKVFAAIKSNYQPSKREPSTAMAEEVAERNYLKEAIAKAKAKK